MKYYRLLDKENNGTIIKIDNQSQYEFDSLKGWVLTSVMLRYWSDSSDTYDMYEEISEKEAITLTSVSDNGFFSRY